MATMLFNAEALMKAKLKEIRKQAKKSANKQSWQTIEKFGSKIDCIVQTKKETLVVLKEGVRTKSSNERKLRREPMGPIVSKRIVGEGLHFV